MRIRVRQTNGRHLVVALEDLSESVQTRRPHDDVAEFPFKRGKLDCKECEGNLGNIQNNIGGPYSSKEVGLLNFVDVRVVLMPQGREVQLRNIFLARTAFARNTNPGRTLLKRLTPAMVTEAEKRWTVNPCRFFQLQGGCKYGDACQFSHVAGGAARHRADDAAVASSSDETAGASRVHDPTVDELARGVQETKLS